MSSANTSLHITSPGARWIRAALQVNPYEYKGHPSPASSYASEDDYNAALLDECERLGISLLAITDHWNATSASGLIAAAEARGITALPGFEATTSEGSHLLVIFEKATALGDLTLAIGACGHTPGDPHGVSSKSFFDIVSEMTSRGAVVIPAHVNVANSGLLHRVTGKPLEPMIKHDGIQALGVSPSTEAVAEQERILRNKAPFTRTHPIVEIHADDVMRPATLGDEGATTWFKMSEPSLAGLQHSLRTPETRVSLTNPASTSRILLREISWVGGFLDGQTVSLAEDLTALIGGRGTGKSTIIESLRYVLEVDPIGVDAGRDHRDVVNSVLRTATTISLVVDVISPEPARYTIERTVPDPAVVRDASGTATAQRPSDIVQSLEIFGQHELAELAQGKSLMAQMVARVAGSPVAALERPALRQDLSDNREALRKVERDQAALEEELADIPRLEEQAKRVADSDLGVKLEQRTAIESERGVFTEAEARLASAERVLLDADLSSVAEQLTAAVPGIEDSPRKTALERSRAALEEAAHGFTQAAEALENAIAAARASVTEARSSWSEEVKPLEEVNATIFRELLDEGHNPDEFVKTQGQLDRLTKRAEQRGVLGKRHKKLIDDRAALMRRLADNDAAIARELNEAIAKANAATSNAVVVKPIADPDRSELRDVFDRHFKGARTQITAAIEKDDFSSRAFVAAARGGAASLAHYGISGAQLKTLLAAGEPLYRELEEVSVGRAVDVQLNIAPKGKGTELRKLEDLSKGQRATALLLMLLGAAASPLIIDQPEDDLDNRFVYDGVVTRLRALKGSRQIIVSTHNANVPVLGDAELVVTLDGDGNHGWPVPDGVGSLDTKSVREHAENLLEGGRDAFNARQHLYGF